MNKHRGSAKCCAALRGGLTGQTQAEVASGTGVRGNVEKVSKQASSLHSWGFFSTSLDTKSQPLGAFIEGCHPRLQP